MSSTEQTIQRADDKYTRLLAAAPDMAEALRAMIHIWDGGADTFSRLQAVKDARAALAKAGL